MDKISVNCSWDKFVLNEPVTQNVRFETCEEAVALESWATAAGRARRYMGQVSALC